VGAQAIAEFNHTVEFCTAAGAGVTLPTGYMKGTGRNPQISVEAFDSTADVGVTVLTRAATE
jgi:hypothetical protein